MGNSFDPDAFLASGSAAVATPTPSSFNPDAFLAQGASHPASSFNPDAFLAATAPPPPPSTTPASDQAAAEPSTVTGKLGEVWRGIDIKSLPADVGKALVGLIGATESPKAFKQAWDVLHGVPVAQAIPESQTFVGIEKKPIQERAKIAGNELINVAGLWAGGKATKEAVGPVTEAAGTIPAPAEAPPVVGNEQFARVTPVNERAGAAVPAENPAPAQSTILETPTQPEPKPVVPITEENAAQAAIDIGGLSFGGVQSWPADSGIPSTLEFTITEPGKETTLSVPPGITPEELTARRDQKLADFAAKEPKPLHVFKNAEDGTEARIYSGINGEFNVVLHDTDANQTVPVAQIFKSEDAAIAYAKNLSGGDQIPSTGEGSGPSGMEAGSDPLKRREPLIQRGNEPGNLPAAQEPPALNKDNLYYQKNLEARAYKMAQGFVWNGKEWVHPDYPGATPFSSDVPPPKAVDVQRIYQKLKEQPTEPVAAQPEPAPVQPTSTKNVVTAAEREQRGIPPAEEAARRDFGTVWDEAARDSANDPSAPQRLVEELGDKPRPVSDKENALVLRRQIELQNEHDAAVRAVNEKPGDATAEARLDRVRDDLQTVYDVTKSIGTETGRGLNARKMLADNEFTLAKMEAETRAVTNQGKPLSPKQLSEVAALHDRIKAAEARIADYETQEQFRQALEEAKTEARAKAKTTTKQGFLAEQAAKARERIVARRGRLNTGIDPTALVDEAIIGAHHISNGLIKFSDWSAQMVKDLGDRIKPYLTDLWKRARQYHQESAKALNQSSHVKRLEQRIEQLTKAIQDRTAIAKTDKVKKEYDPEIKQLIARRTALNAEYKKLFPNTPSVESKLAADKTRIQAGTEKYQARTAAGDTSPLRPKTESRMDKEKSNLLFAREEAKKAYHEMLVKSRLAQQPVWQKGFRYFGEGLRTSRSIKTSFDVSAMFRQGGFNYFGHPIAASRAIRPMLEAIKSPQAEFHVMEEIRSRPNYPEYKQAGLFIAEEGSSRLSKMEEVYASRLSGKIPGVAASERAYTTYLNRVRADRYDAMKATLAKKSALTPDEAKIITNFVNVTTGRGHLAGKFQGAAETLNAAFFAPRYVISRFQTLFGQPLWHMAGKGTPRVRALIGKEYARTLTGIGLFMTAAVAAGASIEADPRSSDFLKMRFGNLRMDPMMGIQQVTVLLSRLLSGKRMTGRGELVPIRGKVKFGQPTASDVISNFARTKLGPPPSAAVNIATGNDPTGMPTTALNELLHFALPLGPGDILSTMTANGVPKKLALALLAAGGMGVSNYSPQSTGEREAYRSRLEASDAALLRGNLPEAFKLRQSMQSTTPSGSSRGGPRAPRH